jgi:hypothetical protein
MHPLQASVNETTTKLAPSGPADEIRNSFCRILSLVDLAKTVKVVMLSKISLSDGFWQMLVDKGQKWNFAYLMPDPPGHPTQIVVPLALQMGWAKSPPYFCAATEMGRDIIQTRLHSHPTALKNTRGQKSRQTELQRQPLAWHICIC